MQINLENYSFYVKPNFIDIRKNARTLAYIVQDEMGLKPFDKMGIYWSLTNIRGESRRESLIFNQVSSFLSPQKHEGNMSYRVVGMLCIPLGATSPLR